MLLRLLLPWGLSLLLMLLLLLLLRSLSLLLALRGLSLFFLFVLPCLGRNSPSEK